MISVGQVSKSLKLGKNKNLYIYLYLENMKIPIIK